MGCEIWYGCTHPPTEWYVINAWGSSTHLMNPRPGPSLDLSPSCDGCIGRSETLDRDSRVHSSTLVYLFQVILTQPFIQLVSYGESKAYGQRHFRHDGLPRWICR